MKLSIHIIADYDSKTHQVCVDISTPSFTVRNVKFLDNEAVEQDGYLEMFLSHVVDETKHAIRRERNRQRGELVAIKGEKNG